MNACLVGFLSLPTDRTPPDPRLIGGSGGEGEEVVKPHVSIKPFVKHPPNLPFFIVPVIGSVLFPQFKGPRSPGVLRAKGRKGAFLYCAPQPHPNLMML